MRKALNENPKVQAGVIAGLLFFVLLLFMTGIVGGGGSGGDTAAVGTTGTTSTTGATAVAGTTSATVATGTTAATGATGTTTATTAPAAAAAPVDSAAATTGAVAATTAIAAPVGDPTLGPRLPKSVEVAYASGRAIVLLVVRPQGIDDRLLADATTVLAGRKDVAVFVATADRVATFSRITQGVSVDRVPALIVVRPKGLSDGTPSAQVSYGYMGPQSVVQAVDDAMYDGPALSYSPG